MFLAKEDVKEENCCCATSSCCAGAEEEKTNERYITGRTDTKVGKIPLLSTTLTKTDRWEHFKVRMRIGRMNYKVEPGIYAVGTPDPGSPVLISANYKLSFDILRRELKNINAWILVLDSKGINVWCAAGKGTFGTQELVNKIKSTGLGKIVNHKKLIVPQLGAPGISAHRVKKLSGFSVIYGPVKASDIPVFLEAGMKAAAEMRRVRFPLRDRIVLIPVELAQGIRYLVFVTFSIFLLSGLYRGGYSLSRVGAVGTRSMFNLLIVYFGAAILGFVLLPYLPGRSFALKGVSVGIILFLISFAANLTGSGFVEPGAWLLMMAALSSFMVMNLTGTSHYTSLSGVQKEMRIAVPLQIGAAAVGSVVWIVSRFL